ncbi:endo-1,4-beta-xylanase [bacterium]|nr:endo-1,4-beta-xylanase [bacterium]
MNNVKRHRHYFYIKRTALSIIFFILFQMPALSQLAEGQEKYFGCILKSERNVPSSFLDYFNQVVPENAGKWGSVEGTRDVYNWEYLDLAYNFALDNDIPFRFHVLVWGKQQPGWIDALSPAEQAEEVEEWFRLAGERYPLADVVEVVNEAITSSYDPYPSYYEALGGEGVTGYDWVLWAFEKARDYFPYSKLYLNEYNILSNSKSINKYLEIIDLLKEEDLIDGVCEQGHYFALKYVSVNTLKNNLNKLAGAGLPISITEFDIEEADDDVQLEKYKIYFPLLWEHEAVEGITLWGYQENKIWEQDAYLVRADGTERPALEWLRTYLSGTGVKTAGPAPSDFTLKGNAPNPFNPSTIITYSLGSPAHVRLSVYDLRGREITTLESGIRDAGMHHALFDGSRLAGGVYVCRLTAGAETRSIKMMMVK